MYDGEILNISTASGTAFTKSFAGTLKHEEIELENLHGWDADA